MLHEKMLTLSLLVVLLLSVLAAASSPHDPNFNNIMLKEHNSLRAQHHASPVRIPPSSPPSLHSLTFVVNLGLQPRSQRKIVGGGLRFCTFRNPLHPPYSALPQPLISIGSIAWREPRSRLSIPERRVQQPRTSRESQI